jgi:predicted Zn-dependent protease
MVKTLVLISLFSFSATASQLKLKATESGVLFNIEEQKTTALPANTVVDYKLESPTFVNLDGRIPVLLVPTRSGASELELNPPTAKDAVGRAAQEEVSRIVSDVYVGIQEVQRDIQRKNFDRASVKVEELLRKYPDVGFLHFTRGSVLFLQGKKKSARRAVMKALESHPDFKEGQEFLKAIGGPLKEGESENE